VSQRQPVFAAFFLDRRQRLIRFSELFRGESDRVVIYPREIVRDALACGAEQLLCVRSDPIGDHQPTAYDLEDARRVKRALDLMMIPLLDYVIVVSPSRHVSSEALSDPLANRRDDYGDLRIHFVFL
jgi:DNA repair protein RadC